jgi:hypothetical protein
MKAGNMGRIMAIAALVAAVGACGGGGDDRATQDGGARDGSHEEAAVDYWLYAMKRGSVS